jgi:hypothetical protein
VARERETLLDDEQMPSPLLGCLFDGVQAEDGTFPAVGLAETLDDPGPLRGEVRVEKRLDRGGEAARGHMGADLNRPGCPPLWQRGRSHPAASPTRATPCQPIIWSA